MARTAVLDSSAILAVIFNEPGSSRIAPLLPRGLLSAVNLSEVHSRLLRQGSMPDDAWTGILGLGCTISFFTEVHARIAAELIARTRPYGLSLGDRACLALAIERKAVAYTTDRAWKSLDLGIDIEIVQ